MNKDIFSNIWFRNFSIFFTVVLTFILLNNNIIENFIWKFPELFVDFKVPVKWLECNYLNYNLFSEDLLKCTSNTFNYGKILLTIPYSRSLGIFYVNYLPYILILISILLINKIIAAKNLVGYTIFYLSIINPSTIFLFERANIDLVIFIALIVIVYSRIYIINWLLTFFLTFLKIYPVIFLINIFIENKLRKINKIFIILFSFFLVGTIYICFNLNEYIYLLKNLSGTKSGYHFLFSLNSLPKIFRHIFDINYIFLILFFYSIFIFITFKIKKTFEKELKKFTYDLYSDEVRLFIIGGYLSLFCFFIFSNWFYREIFLITTFPYFLKLYYENKSSILKFLINFIIFKYLFLFFYSYINVHDNIKYINDLRVFSKPFLIVIFIKSIIDYLLLSIIGSLLIINTKKFYNEFKRKIFNQKIN